jgi:hypothetical protein
MKNGTQKQFAFFGKSMLWSLLLYAVMMLAINWDEVRNAVNGSPAIVVENTGPPGSQAPFTTNPPSAPNISGRTGFVKTMIMLVRTLSGFSAQASAY